MIQTPYVCLPAAGAGERRAESGVPDPGCVPTGRVGLLDPSHVTDEDCVPQTLCRLAEGCSARLTSRCQYDFVPQS